MLNALYTPRTHFRFFILFLLFLITVVNYIDRSAIAFVLPIFKHHLGFDETQLGLILGGFGVGYAVTTFLGGIWVDRYKPRIVMAIAVVMWALSMFVTAIGSIFAMLFFARALLGVAEGPNFSAMTVGVGAWLPAKERARALSYALMAVPVAMAIGAPIVTQLMLHIGWRWMFVALGVLAIAWLPLWLYYFRNTPRHSPKVNQQELAWIDARSENVTPEPVMPKQVWRYLLTNWTLLSNYWAFFVFGYFLFFFMGWLPNYFQQVYHLSLAKEGVFTMLPWLVATAMMWAVGRLSDYLTQKTGSLRWSRSYPIMVSQLLASLCIVPLVLMHHPDFVTVEILIALAVGFSMCANGNYYAINIDIAKKRAGTALGIMDTAFAIAGFLSPVLTGYLIHITGKFDAGFGLLVLFGLSSVVFVACAHHPEQQRHIVESEAK